MSTNTGVYVDPFDSDQVEAVRVKHRPITINPKHVPRYCVECAKPWPCDVSRLLAVIAEEYASFDLRWKADMRGIKMWREGHPEREMMMPDHGDLVCWLIERLDERIVDAQGRYVRRNDANSAWVLTDGSEPAYPLVPMGESAAAAMFNAQTPR